MTEPVPLSWAQQAWLTGPPRLDEHDAWLHEIGQPVRVPADFTADKAATLLQHLVQSYPPLRARLCRQPDGTIVQHIAASDDPSLAEDIRRWAVLTSEHQIPPSVPNIALVLPGETTATIWLAHAFIDGGGVNALVSSVHQMIRSGVPPHSQDQLYRRIAFERSASGAAMSAEAVRYLTRTASAAVDADLVDVQRPVVKGEVPACMGTSQGMFGLMVRFGSGSRLLRASVLLCVAMLAYCGIRDRTGAWLAVNVANRGSAEEREFVGMTIQNGWLLHTFQPEAGFADLVRAVAARLVKCVHHGRYDPDTATRELDRASLPHLPNFYFNYVEPPDIQWHAHPATSTEPDMATRRFKWERHQAAGAGCPFEFNAFAATRSVGLILKYDDRVFTRTDITRFVDILRSITTTVSRNPNAPVAALLTIP
jgi:hypothetical protein